VRKLYLLLSLLISATIAMPTAVVAQSASPHYSYQLAALKKKSRKSRRYTKARRHKRSRKHRRSTKLKRAKARRAAIRRAKARRLKRRRAAAAAKRARLYARQVVRYRTSQKRGTIVIDTRTRHLYHVLGNGRATRYGVAVGKQGFAWSGTSRIRRKVKWPTWTPPAEMIKRKPELAKWAEGQPGGPSNPLGAAALYLFKGKRDTLYRIHGTNAPSSIGRAASSGCIRMRNEDIQHLYARVGNGTKVIVH